MARNTRATTTTTAITTTATTLTAVDNGSQGAHAGRRMRPPQDALGARIAACMDAHGIAQGVLAARLGISRTTLWRFLQGKTLEHPRFSVMDLCAALELVEPERSAFIAACMGGSAPPDNGDPSPATASSTPEAGEPPTTISIEHARQALSAHMRVAHLTASGLAHRLGVAPSTITRLLRGETTRTQTLYGRDVAKALGDVPMDRRAFLEVMVGAGLVAIGPWAPRGEPAPVLLRFHALEEALGKSIEDAEAEVGDLRVRRNRGEFQMVVERARWLFDRLYDPRYDHSAVEHAPELASAKLRVGFEYCESLAATQGWYGRSSAMVGVLNRMEREVLLYLERPHTQFPSEWAHLYNLRAPLYRRQGDPALQRDAHDASIWEFTWALDHVIPHLADEPSIHVELLRNRAHSYLLQGKIDPWRTDLTRAQQVAQNLHGTVGETFQALVVYSWGEGYKHLASRPELAPDLRRRYATNALADLDEGYRAFVRHHTWEGYAMLAALAQAESLIWLDADASLDRAWEVGRLARTLYPSLIEKANRVATLALRQSGRISAEHARR